MNHLYRFYYSDDDDDVICIIICVHCEEYIWYLCPSSNIFWFYLCVLSISFIDNLNGFFF